MKEFYEKTSVLDKYKKLENPTGEDLSKILDVIRGDPELERYFYDKNKQGALSVGWLELLDGIRDFDAVGKEDAGIVENIKARYLIDCAERKPELVKGIIKKIKAKDYAIRGLLLEAILKMPEEIVVGEVPVVLEYIGDRGYKVFFLVGERAAKLMLNFVEKHPKEAFEIARLLLGIWRPGEKEAGVFETIRSKFAAHEYKKLMFDYYCKVWEKRPFEATCVLMEIYNEYLEVCKKEKGYDLSEYLGVSIDDLENIQRLEYDLDAIITKAICEAGRAVIEKEPKRINELLNDLEKRNKGIFHRVEMYLLRFMPPGTERDRINKLIGNQKFIENRLYWHEHRRLLNDKFDEVGEEVRQTFITWVEKPKITEERKKEVEEWCQQKNEKLPDFEKWENQRKAEELYLVRERKRFKDLYEEYKAKSGLNDSALAPRPMVVSKTRRVSPEEGSLYSSETMAKDSVHSVVNYLLDPKNYEGTEKVSGWGTAKDALAASFKVDVKKRPMEYLNVDLKKLERLDPEFLGKIFYSVSEAVREGSFKKEGWERLIDLAHGIVETKIKEKGWKDCFLAILWVLHDGFGEESNRITFNETIIRKIWLILKELIVYNYDEKLESEEDPFQRRLRSVQGGAFGQIVLLGEVCKNDFPTLFENLLKIEMRQVYTFLAKDVKRSEVNCTFGSDFARIYWLDKEWLESNFEQVFDKEMWDAVWGTYVSWGRPSPQCFKLLIEKGIYSRAVEGIEKKNRYKFGKDPNEGLVEHLMIGFFNGWIDFEHKVLKQFFEKASAELRGKAARFLTTGFNSVNKKGGKEKEVIAARMREYWKKRLAAIGDNLKENEKEVIEFTGWVEDSVLPSKETLELLEQSLELSGGKIGKMRDAKIFVGGVCKLGEGNGLLALRCLKKAAADENMHTPWVDIQEPLVNFLDRVNDLSVDIRGVGREVADLYGRYNPDKFHEVWEKLNMTMGSD